MNPTTQNRPSSLDSIAPWLVLLAFLAVGIRTVANADFWMQTAIGRSILDSGLWAADTLTHVGQGKVFVKMGWLYGVLMYWAQGMGGGVVTLLHLGAAGVAFFLLARSARLQSSPLAIGFALLLCLWLLAARLDARPAIFSMIFPAAMISLLSSRPANTATILKMVILQVLWVNIHSSFLIGPLIVIAFGIEAFQGNSSSENLRRDKAPALFLLSGILLAASMLNPSFHHVFAYVLRPDALAQLGEPTASIVQGWTRPFITPFATDFAYEGSAILINSMMLLAAAGLAFHRETLPLARTLLAAAATLLVMKHYISTLEIFAVLIFPLLAFSLGCIGKFLAGLSPRKTGSGNPLLLAGTALLALLALGTALSFVTHSYYIKRGIPNHFGLGIQRDVFPAEAMAVINRDDFPSNFIHLPADGGFLETHLAKGRKAFLDARSELHSGAYQDLVDILIGGDKAKTEEASRRMFGEWHPGAAVINTTLPYAREILSRLLTSGAFQLAYFDGTTAILVVPSQETRSLLADPSVQQKGLAILEAEKNAYRKDLGGGIPAPIPARLLGGANALLALNQPREALLLFSLLRAGNPTLYSGRLHLAVLQRANKEYEPALITLNEAMALMPTDPKPHLIRADILKAMGRDKDAEDSAAEARRLSEIPKAG